MRILIVPSSYSNKLNIADMANNIETAAREIYPQAHYIKLPVSVSGSSPLPIDIAAASGIMEKAIVTGPLGNHVRASFGLIDEGNTAIINMAQASGLALAPVEFRNPYLTTSFGTGELILAALKKGVKKIFLHTEGGATNDAGVGMMQALGGIFTDTNGDEITYGGYELKNLKTLDLSHLTPLLKNVAIYVACDRHIALCGPKGTSYVEGIPKNASKDMMLDLDKALAHFATVVENNLDQDIRHIPGAGIAGGMGASLVAFLGAKLIPSIDMIQQEYALLNHIKKADFIICGDKGKTCYSMPISIADELVNLATEQQIPALNLTQQWEENNTQDKEVLNLKEMMKN